MYLYTYGVYINTTHVLFSLVLNKRMHVGRRFGASLQPGQLHQHHALDHLALRLADQPHRRLQCAARRQQIVDHDHPLTRPYGVRLDFQHVHAVLQLVLQLDTLAGQLALLANRHTAAAELGGDQQAEQKATRLQANDHLDIRAFRANMPDKQLLDCLAHGAVGQRRENVPIYRVERERENRALTLD